MQIHEFTTADELALLVDAVQDYAMFLLGTDGEIRSWNRGAERIFGYAADEAVGSNFSRFYSSEDIANRKPQRELETARDEGRVEDEGWRYRKDGTRFWVNTVITAIRDQSGELRGFAKVTRDLTERRESEERLRRSEEMFSLLVGSVQEYAIFMLDTTGHVMSWNAGAQRIKGYEPQEIIGRHFSVFYPPEDQEKAITNLETAKRDGIVEDEGWRVRKDGTRFWANVVISAIYDRSGQLAGFAKITRDVTERREAEMTRVALLEQREARLIAEDERHRAEASYRAAQEANRAKDEFLMTLSHELRTPMTSIVGWSRLLVNMQPDDPMFRDALRSISRSAQHQARLIDDVLDVSRIISGKLRLIIEATDVVAVLRMAVEAVRPAADAKRITLEMSLGGEIGNIAIDATRFQQVVWNLLTNAVKFTPKGGTIVLSARRTASQLQVQVKDSGEGIDPQFLPHMFEPFRQAEGSTTRVHGGLGLGLSIVRYLVEAHGGSVTAVSAGRGSGSTFTVTLPIRSVVTKRVAEPEAEVSETDPEPISPVLRGLKILIVDDDDEGRDLVRAVLTQAGADVTAADSAAAATQLLARSTPDVIITDIAMPSMDGFEFARRLRLAEETKKTKIVALSAFPPGQKVDAAFDAHFVKPIDPADLVLSINSVVRQ